MCAPIELARQASLSCPTIQPLTPTGLCCLYDASWQDLQPARVACGDMGCSIEQSCIPACVVACDAGLAVEHCMSNGVCDAAAGVFCQRLVLIELGFVLSSYAGRQMWIVALSKHS